MKITLQNLPQFTQEFLANISEKNWRAESGATVILLSGDLGAGKTTFTKAVAHELGIEEEVTSPTFVIEKRYEIPLLSSRRRGSMSEDDNTEVQDDNTETIDDNNSCFKNFYHIDAYRLESGKEIEDLGLREILADTANLIFIEWPEKVASAHTHFHNPITISFKVIDETTREIIISNGFEKK
jgi:tRNA threonylcarbamoyladenosine biosynthesis protein TsaE